LVKRHSSIGGGSLPASIGGGSMPASIGGGSMPAFAIGELIAYAHRSNPLPMPVPQR